MRITNAFGALALPLALAACDTPLPTLQTVATADSRQAAIPAPRRATAPTTSAPRTVQSASLGATPERSGDDGAREREASRQVEVASAAAPSPTADLGGSGYGAAAADEVGFSID